MLAARSFRSFTSNLRRGIRGVASRVSSRAGLHGRPWVAGILTTGVVIGSYVSAV